MATGGKTGGNWWQLPPVLSLPGISRIRIRSPKNYMQNVGVVGLGDMGSGLAKNLIKNGFDFQKEYPFESSLILIALVSLIGKLISISLLFSKNILNKKNWIYIGLTLMLISFLFVCYGAWEYDNFLFAITLGSGIPFLMYFGRILYLIKKENNKTELVPE